MAGERVDGSCVPGSGGGVPPELIAARLRQTAAAGVPPPLVATERFSVEEWLSGDAGHLHRAGDLTTVPIASHRRHAGRFVLALKRTIRRLLFPLLDVQTSVNLANARVVTFLLHQVAAQARRIEELDRRVAELREERET